MTEQPADHRASLLPGVIAIVQPYSGAMRSMLETLAVRASGGSCRICTAWMTPDGLALANDLCRRNDVALKEIIVGINRRGTSARALRIGLDVLAQYGGVLRHYLDGKLAGPIYHPKIWLMEAPTFRAALVGSSNLTREGLLDNFEAGLVLCDGATALRNEASSAIDELASHLGRLEESEHSTVVDDAVIARLIEIGAIPETTERAQRDDADEGAGNASNADRLLGVRSPRPRQSFRPQVPLPDTTVREPHEGRGMRADVVVAVPLGARLRYVRYYGLSEANRVQKYFREGGSAGTFEPNISMTTQPESDFWGYPDRFAMNQNGTAREWSPRVRLITQREGRTVVTTIPSARLWTRIREGRQTEVRFRFANTAAVRDTFPLDIDELTVLVVDQVDDTAVDYEVRLVGRREPGYAALCPTGDRNYEYRVL